MGVSTIILPDVGEGIAEAELTEWILDNQQSIHRYQAHEQHTCFR